MSGGCMHVSVSAGLLGPLRKQGLVTAVGLPLELVANTYGDTEHIALAAGKRVAIAKG